jgi:Flp pilus assembly protein TadB
MSELFIILLIAAAALYWRAAARSKEIAADAARRECNLNDVQLLDQSVNLIRLSASRDLDDRWRLWRAYRFEYATNGEDRFVGRVTTLGQKVTRIEMETFGPLVH